jgi:hypothetical protein
VCLVQPRSTALVVKAADFFPKTLQFLCIPKKVLPPPERFQKTRYTMFRNPLNRAPILAAPRLKRLCGALQVDITPRLGYWLPSHRCPLPAYTAVDRFDMERAQLHKLLKCVLRQEGEVDAIGHPLLCAGQELRTERSAIELYAAQVDLIDRMRVRDVVQGIGVQHNEVGFFARGDYAHPGESENSSVH